MRTSGAHRLSLDDVQRSADTIVWPVPEPEDGGAVLRVWIEPSLRLEGGAKVVAVHVLW